MSSQSLATNVGDFDAGRKPSDDKTDALQARAVRPPSLADHLRALILTGAHTVPVTMHVSLLKGARGESRLPVSCHGEKCCYRLCKVCKCEKGIFPRLPKHHPWQWSHIHGEKLAVDVRHLGRSKWPVPGQGCTTLHCIASLTRAHTRPDSRRLACSRCASSIPSFFVRAISSVFLAFLRSAVAEARLVSLLFIWASHSAARNEMVTRTRVRELKRKAQREQKDGDE